MVENEGSAEDRDERLDALIDEYIQAVERYGPQDREHWLSRYPEFATALRPYLDGVVRVSQGVDQTRSFPAKQPPDTEPYQPGIDAVDPPCAPPAVTVGALLGGKFRVLDVKRGGMGCVYFVTGIGNRDKTPKGVFKSVLPFDQWRSNTDDPEDHTLVARYSALLFRFRREAMNWVRLKEHANIIRAANVFEIGGLPYLLLEYADSGDLATRIGKGGLSVRLVVDLALQFCAGMSHAVRCIGLVHRDIKPANVLLHQQWQVKITDLGLSRASGDDEQHARRVLQSSARDGMSLAGGGTIPYMAPEQFISLGNADTRSDVFSFGAMLFEMLTSARLFGDVDAFRASANGVVLPKAHELNPQVPRSLSEVVEWCTAYDPEQRLRSFNSVAKAILETGLSQRWTLKRTASKAESHDERNRRDWNREVWSLLSLGHYEAAEDAAQQAIKEEPACHGHWLNRGKALAELGRISEAHQCYAKAAELEPGDVQCWFNLAYALNDLGRAADGLTSAHRAIAIDERCSEAWDAAGCCTVTLQDSAAALEYFQRAASLERGVATESTNWRALMNLGLCLADLERHEEALDAFQRAVAANPSLQQGWFQIAWLLTARSQFEDALAAVHRCLRLNERHVGAWSLRGHILIQTEKSDDDLISAAESFRRAIQLDPNHLPSREMLRRVKSQLDDFERNTTIREGTLE